MKYLLAFIIILSLGQNIVFGQNKSNSKISKETIKKSTSPATSKSAQEKSNPSNAQPSTETSNVPSPAKPIATHTLNDLDLNCLNRGTSECRSKEGAKCELLNLHSSEILRLQLDPDSTPHTFIAENKYKKCESYWVTEQCRVLGADICDADQKLKIFGPPPAEEPSFFNSSLFD